MVLLDSSVWIDHLRKADSAVSTLLEEHEVLCHPFVIGELACGSLARRPLVVSTLSKLPRVTVAEHHEVLSYIDTHKLKSFPWVLKYRISINTSATWSKLAYFFSKTIIGQPD